MEFLDALRGIAALAVAVAHRAESMVPGFSDFDAEFFRFGQFGVVVFFLCSGFIIPASLERHHSLRAFWIGRFFRLFPLYLIVLAALLLLAAGGLFTLSPDYLADPVRSSLVNTTMLQALIGAPVALGLSWTLGFEMGFYIVMSVLFALGVSRRSTTLAATAVAVAVALGLLNSGLPIAAMVLVAGVAGLLMLPVWQLSRSKRGLVLLLLLAPLVLMLIGNRAYEAWFNVCLFAVMFIGTVLYRHSTGDISGRAALAVYVLSAAAVTSTVHANADRVSFTPTFAAAFAVFGLAYTMRRLRFPQPLMFLGLISYSVYLVHPIVYALCPAWTSIGWLNVALAVGPVLIVSALSYHVVERRMVIRGRTVVKRQLAAGEDRRSHHIRTLRGPMSETDRKSTPERQPAEGRPARHHTKMMRNRRQVVIAAATVAALAAVVAVVESASSPTSITLAGDTAVPSPSVIAVPEHLAPALSDGPKSAEPPTRSVPAPPVPPASDVPGLSAADNQMVRLVDDIVHVLEESAPPGAPPGTWHDSAGCFRCDAGPGLALASIAAVTNGEDRRERAIAIFDQIIAANQRPDGAFGKGEHASDIDTMFFAAELGMAAIVLDSDLDAAHRKSWAAAVAGAADFLVANKNLAWYTNGNINIGNTLVMALADRLTGRPRFAKYYEQALQFTMAPPQQKWNGFGLRYTAAPQREDGSDGKAFFAETGTSRPGYDAEYTMLQLDLLTRIFLTNGDPRIMRLMNLVLNQLLDRVDVATMLLDTSGGTRHPDAGRKIVFDTSGLSAVVHLGSRKSLQPILDKQIPAIDRSFRAAGPDQGGRMKYALGMIAASIIMSQRDNADLR